MTYASYLIICYHFFDTAECENEIPSICEWDVDGKNRWDELNCELLFELSGIEMCDRSWDSSPHCDKAPKQLKVKDSCKRTCNNCEGKFSIVIIFLEYIRHI